MEKAIYICLGHKTFSSGRIALVSILEERKYITDYVEIAKEKFCKQLGVNPDEVTVLNWFFVQDISVIA